MGISRYDLARGTRVLDRLGQTVSGFRAKQDEDKDIERMKALSWKFMQLEDKSAESLQKFAEENGITLDEFQKIANAVKGFDYYSKKYGTDEEAAKKLENALKLYEGKKNIDKDFEKPRFDTFTTHEQREGGGQRKTQVPAGDLFTPKEGFGFKQFETPGLTSEQQQAADLEKAGLLQRQKARITDELKVPGPSLEDKIAETEALSAARKRGTLSETPKKPGMTRTQALNLKADIKKSRLELEKGESVNPLIIMLASIAKGADGNPIDIARFEGQKLPEDLKQELIDAWDEQLANIQPFIDGGNVSELPGDQSLQRGDNLFAPPELSKSARKIVRRGKINGRDVAEYSDGKIQ